MKLIAIKPMRYRTRRLQAGDEFEETNDVFARVLVGARKARYVGVLPNEPVNIPMPPVKPTLGRRPESAEQVVSLDDLREEAERRGIDVDRRWGRDRLNQEIAKAKL